MPCLPLFSMVRVLINDTLPPLNKQKELYWNLKNDDVGSKEGIILQSIQTSLELQTSHSVGAQEEIC